MFDVSFWELAVVGVIALIIIGPERLPTVARAAGHWVGRARRILRDAKADLDRELREHEIADVDELKRDLEDAGATLKIAGEQVAQSGDELRETFQQASPLMQNSAAEKITVKKRAAKKSSAKKTVKKKVPNKKPAKKLVKKLAKKKTTKKKSKTAAARKHKKKSAKKSRARA